MIRVICTILVLTLISCKQGEAPSTTTKPNDEIIAKVGKQKLYLTDISGLSKGESEKDSLHIVNGYIEQWTQRMVVLEEAESKVSSVLNIDQLVEDYRSSLILHNYKVKLVEEKLNTDVSEEELKAFYEKNKEQFKLGENVAKVYIAKIAPTADKNILKKFFKYWKKNNLSKVDQKINELTTFRFTEKDRWVTMNELSTILPSNINPDRLRKGDTFKKHKGIQYYVKVFELIKANQSAPFSLIKDQVKKTIINQRKKDLLENHEEELYKKALENNMIEVYNK